jgi:adenylate cyclase
VTAFAGVLDLATGELAYCNAGHENPWLAGGESGACHRIDDGAGPPLCAVEGFDYRSGVLWLQPGDFLCLVTDGIIDARDPAGGRYGSERVQAVIADACRTHATPEGLVEAVCADVRGFMAGADPVDDYTVLAVRWNGPTPAAWSPTE